jgi:tripartite-type tricarboxylate transporter receptor subunit TctC
MWTQNARDQRVNARPVEARGRPWKPKKPYRGAAPALTDLIAGQVEVMFDNLPSSVEHIRGGKIRALGVTTAKRADALPDVPSIGETVPGYEANVFYGIAAPKGTPSEIVGKLHQAVDVVLADPRVKRWSRLSEQIFRVDKWNLCRVRLPSGVAAG